MVNANVKNKLVWILALVVFAINAALSGWVPLAYAQFIDRIVHPCSGASARGTVQVTQTNVLINPCPGGTVTINGVPITPGAGLPDPGSNGFVVRTALNTDLARTLTVASPLTIANATGVAGNPLFSCPTCVTSAAALTNFALMTGAALQGSKTPSVTATLLANGNISTPGSVTTGNAGGVTGALDLSGLTSGTVTITVAAIAGTWTFRLPTDDGAANQYLQTDGAGVTSWQTVAAGVTCVGCTTNTLPKTTGASALGNSRVTDNGTDILATNPTGDTALGDTGLSGNGSAVDIDNAIRKTILQAAAVDTDVTILTLDGPNKTFTAKALAEVDLDSPRIFLSRLSGGNGTTVDINDTAKTINLNADVVTGAVNLSAAAVTFTGNVALFNRITLYNSAVPTDGLLLIGSTGTGAFRTGFLTASSPIVVTNGSGTVALTCPTCVALGGTPGIAGNATLNSGSKDTAGKITSAGTGASTAVLTFSTTYARAPACVVTNETTSNLVRPVSTTTTLTVNATVVTGDSISYICVAY